MLSSLGYPRMSDLDFVDELLDEPCEFNLPPTKKRTLNDIRQSLLAKTTKLRKNGQHEEILIEDDDEDDSNPLCIILVFILTPPDPNPYEYIRLDPTSIELVNIVEQLPFNGRILCEKQLIEVLCHSSDCFFSTPRLWYKNFELLKKQHEEVLNNITDFNSWVVLLQYSECQMALNLMRNSFHEFLKRYPYCYGYWKNYADIELRFGDLDNVFKIYQNALRAFPNSVDLWIFYLNFIIERSAAENCNPILPPVITEHQWSNEQVDNLFKQAVGKIGSDFKSEPFWDLFISWEMKHGSMKNVTKIYDDVLRRPIAAYRYFFAKFKNHIETNDLHNILDSSEIDSFIRDMGLNSTYMDLDDDQIITIRQKILESRQSIVTTTEEEVKRIKPFEDNIRRPYYHIKPLERFQLKNWMNYLDFIMTRIPDYNQPDSVAKHRLRIRELFERCLVTCANYEEFWLKFAKHLETYDLTTMRHVLQRAAFIHLPTKTNIFTFWAALEEKYGNYQTAFFLLNLLDANVPDLMQTAISRINLVRRSPVLQSRLALEFNLFTTTNNTNTNHAIIKKEEPVNNDSNSVVNKKDDTVLLTNGENQGYDATETDIDGKIMENYKEPTLLTDDGEPCDVKPDLSSIAITYDAHLIIEAMYRALLKKYATNLCYYGYYVIQYARFLDKVKNSRLQAQQLLLEAIATDANNEKLYLLLIDLEYQNEPFNIDAVIECFDLALNSTLPETSKTAFAQRKYEFLEAVDNDVMRINQARDEFTSMLKSLLGGEFGPTYNKNLVKSNTPLSQPASNDTNGDQNKGDEKNNTLLGGGSSISTHKMHSNYYANYYQSYFAQLASKGASAFKQPSTHLATIVKKQI